jgi:hypothetical protein
MRREESGEAFSDELSMELICAKEDLTDRIETVEMVASVAIVAEE